jgi:heme-degrading monooxygenase HmoA
MHTIVWEYRVKPGREADFERLYGPEGEWVRLFGRSLGYRGTQLLRDVGGAGSYVTIDRWDSRHAYELFRGTNAAAYAELDARCAELCLDEKKLAERRSSQEEPGFWRRQFEGAATEAQVAFDVALGILAPIVCLAMDPIVFKSSGGFWMGGSPMLARYRLFAYMLSLLAFACLALALWRRPRSGLLAGALAVASAFSTGVGLVLLPLSGMGLLMGIGALGFIPFPTAFVYARNAIRALTGPLTGSLAMRAAAGALAFLALPCGAHVSSKVVERLALTVILDGGPDARETAARWLRRFGPLVDPDRLVWAWALEPDAERRQRLSTAYAQITGEDIASRHAFLVD